MTDQIPAASCTGAATVYVLSSLRRSDRTMATLPPSASRGGDAGGQCSSRWWGDPCCERNGWQSAHHGGRCRDLQHRRSLSRMTFICESNLHSRVLSNRNDSPVGSGNGNLESGTPRDSRLPQASLIGGIFALNLTHGRPAQVFRALVDQVTLVPKTEELAVVLRGDLAAILRFVACKKNPDFLSEAWALDRLLSQASVVAGPGFEPGTFRL